MALTKLEFTRKPFEDGRTFGDTGAYEQLEGKAHFALDPDLPLNQVITDMELAPRGDDGRVHFSADFTLLRPADPKRGNRRLFVDLPNRGREVAISRFDIAPPTELFANSVGEGWLLNQGHTILACGWQHDAPQLPGRLRAYVPEALQDGNRITGPIMCGFQINAPTRTLMLSDMGHRPYPSAAVDDLNATLLVREYPGAEPEIIPRDQWSFARLEDGQEVPDPTHIYLSEGFDPGKRYEVIYTALGAPLTGIGLAVTRDLASFIKYASSDEGNPCAGELDIAYAFGVSQSGAALRHLLYLGLCEDEHERLVFEGLLHCVAGARRSGANWRFGQPSPFVPPSVVHLFPFTDLPQTEPSTGETDGLQSRAIERGKVPKVIYANSSAEYWVSQAALAHTTLDGRDAEIPENVRIYHFAGTQHRGFPLPLITANSSDGTKALYPFNHVNYVPLMRAAFANLDRWVSDGVPSPPSKHPRVSDGTAIGRDELRERFPNIPGVSLPKYLPPVGRFDFGPDMDKSIATQLPPKIVAPYPALVPSVDEDGNEVAGIRLPDVAVPLATYTGWNRRHPDIGGEDQNLYLAGATLPFQRTRSERIAEGDPRASIEERYVSKEAYLERVTAVAKKLVTDGYLLKSDMEYVMEQAAQRYDAFTNS